jgi:hypothetical protein
MAATRIITSITVERKLFRFPRGTSVSAAFCETDPSACCPGSGSGSGSGSGGGECLASATCCGGTPIPCVLHLTVENLDDGCPCLAGEFELVYNFGAWEGSPFLPPGSTDAVQWNLVCIGAWVLRLAFPGYSDGPCSFGGATSQFFLPLISCDPFLAQTASQEVYGCCCDGLSGGYPTISATVTE